MKGEAVDRHDKWSRRLVKRLFLFLRHWEEKMGVRQRKKMGAGENGSCALLSPFSLCFFVASAWKMGKGYAFCAFSLFSDVSACRKWGNVSLVRFL